MDNYKNKDKNNNSSGELKYKRKIHYYIIIIVIFAFISLFLFLGIFLLTNPKSGKINTTLKALSAKLGKNKIINKGNKNNLIARQIDGILVSKGEDNIFPLAVMIDNHINARPPVGLDKAQLVYETEAEGGITRYLAIFAAKDNIDKIGPVRSARPYFIDWEREFSALYAHVGGSPAALVKLKKENINDINEFYNENYFWRDTNRLAPHNVFTSTELLNKFLQTNKFSQSDYFSWQYKDEKININKNQSKEIKIKFNLPGYIVGWKYSNTKNDFIRYLDSIPYKTADGNIIRAKNVIIQYVNSEIIDDKLRLKVETTGSGKAIACLDGECYLAVWKKKNPYARTRFYERGTGADKAPGAELKFNRGITWIEAVNPEIEVIY